MPFNIIEYMLYNYMEEHEECLDKMHEYMTEFAQIRWEGIPQ